jgi:hypothetical protein
VERTLSINVLNTAPYFYSAVSSKRVGVDGQMTIDLYSKFYDNEYQSLTLYDASYTLNSVTSAIPGSFFSIVSSRNILVDPTPTS